MVNALTADARLGRRTILHSTATAALLLLLTTPTKRDRPMSNPVIDSVAPAGPVTAPVGSKVTITVTAHDDDTHTGKVHLVVEDGQGNTSQPVDVAIQWVDGLKVIATTDDGKPVVVSGMTVTVG